MGMIGNDVEGMRTFDRFEIHLQYIQLSCEICNLETVGTVL